MKIDIRKNASKPNMLVCVRADGSTTWQSYENQSNFFPYHDLTHYVVETELGFRHGFYGMILSGRTVQETGANVPNEGQVSETLVGILSTSGFGSTMTFEDVKTSVDQRLAGIGLPSIELSESQLRVIRERCEEIFFQWHELAEGESLCLAFPNQSECQ
jgi:hypothetical protein